MESTTDIDHDRLSETAAKLPPLPATTTEIINVLSDPLFEVSHLIRLVTLEPTLTANLLRVANSAAHGASRTVSSVAEAVVRLGSGTVLAMALAESTRPPAGYDLSAFGLTVDSYWRHCIASVAAAEEMQTRQIASFGSGFCSAALLHDYGKLILSRHINADMQEQMKNYRQAHPGVCEIEAEQSILGIDHAVAGSIVARHWNLPEGIVNTIAQHHDPVDWECPMTNGVVLVNQIAKESTQAAVPISNAEQISDAMISLGLTDAVYQEIINFHAARFEILLSLFST